MFTPLKKLHMQFRRDCVVAVNPLFINRQSGIIDSGHLRQPVLIDVVSNPEFLAQGSAVRDTLQASRCYRADSGRRWRL